METPQTELHRHLDICIRTGTLLELLQARGLESESTSLEAFQERVILRKPLTNLRDVLARFELFPRVYDHPSVCARVAFEAVEDCRNEGTRKVELRYSPGFVSSFTGLDWRTALEGFDEGLRLAKARYPEVQAGLICIASRDRGIDAAAKTVEFFLSNRSRFCGIDLAGDEAGYPCREFERVFRPAVQAGAPITIHAGEATGPDAIWEAIERLGAHRIGHGIACVKDRSLLEHLARRGICLEMCPTSNWLIGAVKDLSRHPLVEALRTGVPVCVNTDDPGVFGVTLPGELEVCRARMGLSPAELALCLGHAAEHSFL